MNYMEAIAHEEGHSRLLIFQIPHFQKKLVWKMKLQVLNGEFRLHGKNNKESKVVNSIDKWDRNNITDKFGKFTGNWLSVC